MGLVAGAVLGSLALLISLAVNIFTTLNPFF